MKNHNENYIEIEVRVRILEDIAAKIDKRFDKIDDKFKHFESKIDNQFHWMLGIMMTMFGGIILHMAKLI